MTNDPLSLKPGDHIQVRAKGVTREGIVKAAHNWGKNGQDDWYIWFTDALYGVVYWKQGIDGGYVRKLK